MSAANDLPKDTPLDALVEDLNDGPISDADYPYYPRVPPLRHLEPAGTTNQVIRLWFLRFKPPSPARYMVPKRFGMSAILGIMTALALLFGAFRLLNLPPGVYLFFGLQTLVICIAQMLNGKSPRLASSIAGAALVPLFILPLFAGEMRMWGRGKFMVLSFLMIFGVPFGAFLGYLTGTCAAGIFLVMDFLEPYLQGRRDSSHSSGA